MIADAAELNRRYRPLVFDIGVTCGLWLLVATSVYVAKEAERAYLDRSSVVADTRRATSVHVDAKPRDKDDGSMFVAAPAAGHIAALPMARPIRVQDSTGQSWRQKYAADAVPPRHEPFEFAGAERFDRCAPVCESRDPLIASTAATPEVYRSLTISSASPAPLDTDAALHVGREFVEQIVDLPRATLDTGREALESLIHVVQ